MAALVAVALPVTSYSSGEPMPIDIFQSALLTLCTILVGFILREQLSIRRRLGEIEVAAGKAKVYLALLCESLGIPYKE